MSEVKIYSCDPNLMSPPADTDKWVVDFVLATHYETLGKKLTDMAVQLANAESKCRELAAVVAENSAIKVMNDFLSEELRGYESDGAFEGPKMHLLWWKVETPATDAFLAEVRAQGVDAAIEHLSKKFEGTGHLGVPIMALEWLAQELRKGAAL